MDGGQLQAEAAQQQLESMGIHIPILGMVKDDRHRTRALVTPQGQELGIQQSPPLFALVGRVQEEVHRFAITYHHEKHSRSAMTSRLDGIPGIGDVRKKGAAEALQERQGHLGGGASAAGGGGAQGRRPGGIRPFP